MEVFCTHTSGHEGRVNQGSFSFYHESVHCGHNSNQKIPIRDMHCASSPLCHPGCYQDPVRAQQAQKSTHMLVASAGHANHTRKTGERTRWPDVTLSKQGSMRMISGLWESPHNPDNTSCICRLMAEIPQRESHSSGLRCLHP